MEKEKEELLNEGRELVAAADPDSNRDGSASPAEEVTTAPDEHPDPDNNREYEDRDYSNFSKRDFVDLVKSLVQETDFRKVDYILREIKPIYDENRDKERAAALKVFIDTGGKESDFEFKSNPLDTAYEATLRLLRDKKAQFIRSQEDQKVDNLRKKTEMLERVRALVDAEDTEQGFHQFKELQKQWKTIGPVPNAHAKTTWANYTALVDRFYDNRSIYFELKELDRKKNLEAKLDICVRAEKLIEVERLKDAVKELNELHHEFKHIGPVPKDEQEIVWTRFKAASDAVYAKRDSFLEELNKQQSSNLNEKLKIAEEVAAFANFQTDRIKEWNQKTQEILAIQKRWEEVGGVARAKAKDVNKKFWSSFKAFFSKKSVFFKKLDEERDKNLKIKQEIIQRALALKESTDWDKTANALKDLQREWKDVGPVPEKLREKIFQEFKEACDFFFEQRRGQFEKQETDQEQNLKDKDAVCEELEKAAAAKTGTVDQFHELTAKYNAAGFVPKRAINDSKARFRSAVDKYVHNLQGVSNDEKERLMMEVQLGNLRNDPQAEQKIYQKEQTIRKKINKVENDIALLRNNMEFFGRSKNAEKLKEEFGVTLRENEEHLKTLKSQLKMLKTAV